MPIDDPTQIFRVKIFPPIGIARVGDSGFDLESGKPDLDTLEYFLPSEIPGSDDVFENGTRRHRSEFKFREEYVRENGYHRIKRQGVRFRVYAYSNDGTNLGEITTTGGYKLTWTVHVANHKASAEVFRGMYRPRTGALRNPGVQGDQKPEDRDRLIVDPGPKTISSPDIHAIVDISGMFYGSQANGIVVHLGQLRTNDEGHLIFIGGAGYSRSVTNPKIPQPDIVSAFDSADWIDDICDGWVKVLVDHDGFGAVIESSKATVLSAPPKFVWGIRSPTTWYDLIADIYAKHPITPWYDNDHGNDDERKKVGFYHDIWPILQATCAISWTNKDAFDGHGVSAKANYLEIKEKLGRTGLESKVDRQAIFNRLRAPDYKVFGHASTRYMPRLSGNDGDAIEPGGNLPSNTGLPPIKRYAALTALQYERFSLWKDGKFDSRAVPWEASTTVEEVALEDQPACLTRAALDHTIGEPLYPGMEAHWIAREPGTYILEVDTNSTGTDPPFRINHEVMAPGHLTWGLSMPWQSDFDLCDGHWWPSIKPDDVINAEDFAGANVPETEFINSILPQRQRWSRGIRISPGNPNYYPGSVDMVKYWSRLGFVVKHENKIARGDQNDPAWLETEREKIVRRDRGTHLAF